MALASIAALTLVTAGTLGACGADAPKAGRASAAATRAASDRAVARLERFGAFVVLCGRGYVHRDIWTVQDGLHRLTRARVGGVSSMSVSDSGTVVYGATEVIGDDVHVLSPETRGASIVGPGKVPEVAPDGRIAFVRTKQQRPLRDDVYVYDGKHTRKVARFPLVWSLFWHRGQLAAMIGPGRTHLVWDIEHPKQRLTLPGRGGRTIQVHPGSGLVAAQVPLSGHRFALGIASRSQPRFRRVAGELYPLAWSPSGRFLLASEFPPSTRLSIVDVRRRATARVGTLACGTVVQAAWLPRGAKLPPTL